MTTQLMNVVITCIVTALFGFLSGKLTETRRRMKIRDKADKYMLKNSITRACLAALDTGRVHSYELESICDMFNVYRSLGGNSYVETLVEKTKKLDIKQD